MANIAERLKLARKNKGLTQPELAKKINVHPITISKYENGGNIPNDVVTDLAEKLDVDRIWLLTGIGAAKEKPDVYGIVTDSYNDYTAKAGTRVPILGLMPAGTRTEILDDEKKGEMWLPFTDIKDCVAYYITGNSMENLYYEGDLVIVRPRPIDQEIHDGRIYGLDYKIDDQLYRTVKYVYREGRDAFRLRSKNGSHKDIIVKDVIRFYRIIREIRGFTDQLA